MRTDGLRPLRWGGNTNAGSWHGGGFVSGEVQVLGLRCTSSKRRGAHEDSHLEQQMTQRVVVVAHGGGAVSLGSSDDDGSLRCTFGPKKTSGSFAAGLLTSSQSSIEPSGGERLRVVACLGL
jgi:hypothetical protein